MDDIISLLSANTGLSEAMVRRTMISAPVRYKDFYIEKKNGGIRKISQPAREVKLIQREFSRLFLKNLPVHKAATAYIKGASIKDNAGVHAGNTQILKMDFENFFPSIKRRDWISYCSDHIKFSQDELVLIASLLFRKPVEGGELHLAIGAPSSPIVSNALMFDFDTYVFDHCEQEKITYTRYADDLTFSSTRTGYLNSAKKIVASAIKHVTYPSRLKINEKKTIFATTKYKRQVTGLILSNDGRVTIGRAKKREIRARIHYYVGNKLSDKEAIALAGYIAFIKAVEPEYVEKLRAKFGPDVILRLKHSLLKCIVAYNESKNKSINL